MLRSSLSRSSLVVAGILVMMCLLKGIHGQKHVKGGNKAVGTPPSSPPEKTPYLPIPFLGETSGIPTHQHSGAVSLLVQQNSSLPFSVRFPRPERKSSKFHYPMLPTVYWSLHKRPEVPLVEPEQELGFGLDYD